jgi:transposase
MVTNKQLQKSKELADLFEDYKKSKMSPIKFCKERGIHTSKFYYWIKRFESKGMAGLIDQRKGTSYKITEN